MFDTLVTFMIVTNYPYLFSFPCVNACTTAFELCWTVARGACLLLAWVTSCKKTQLHVLRKSLATNLAFYYPVKCIPPSTQHLVFCVWWWENFYGTLKISCVMELISGISGVRGSTPNSMRTRGVARHQSWVGSSSVCKPGADDSVNADRLVPPIFSTVCQKSGVCNVIGIDNGFKRDTRNWPLTHDKELLKKEWSLGISGVMSPFWERQTGTGRTSGEGTLTEYSEGSDALLVKQWFCCSPFLICRDVQLRSKLILIINMF